MFADRIKYLGLEEWRAAVINETENLPQGWEGVEDRQNQLEVIESTLATYERLEVVSLVELTLWGMELDKVVDDENKDRTKRQKLTLSATPQDYVSLSATRQISRVNCGAGIVIPNVLSFL